MVQRLADPEESFEEVLAWLHPDRQTAATIYVNLQEDLTRIFSWNHCSDPEGLTDEAFDRVSKKINHLRQSFDGNPRLFFYGVARNLIREEAKKRKAYASLEGIELEKINSTTHANEETAEMRAECLQSCLQKLGKEQRKLIVAYYARDKQAKIDYRHELAQQLGVSVGTLRVRVHRLRSTLGRCMERCLKKMAQ